MVETSTDSVVAVEPIVTTADVATNDGLVGADHAEPVVDREASVTRVDVSGAIDHRIVLITNDPETALTVSQPVKATPTLASPVTDGLPVSAVSQDVAVTKLDVSEAPDHRIVLITNDPETVLTVPGPVNATPALASPVTDGLPVSAASQETGVTKVDVLGAPDHRIVLITNDPETALTVPEPARATPAPASPVTDGLPDLAVSQEAGVTELDALETVMLRSTLTANDPEWTAAVLAAIRAAHDLGPAMTEAPPDSVTTDPPSPGTSVPASDDQEIDWCAGARETPRSDDEPSWRDFLRPPPRMPPEWYSDTGGLPAGEPPPGRPPG